MCGLVGFAGMLEHKHRNAMKELLFLNTLRGKDSTGLTSVSRDKLVLTRKMTVPGYEFIEHPTVDRIMKHGDQLWLGHGRYKTHGDISRANAHPFEVLTDEGEVLLVGTHNGTLVNKAQVEGKANLGKFETDSEALFNWLTVAPDYKKAIAELRGAWSLVWWDPTTNCLHFCRNDERPLVYAYTKDRKALVWASEAWMIINACRRNGVELDKSDKGTVCLMTNVDTLYTLEIPQERDRVLPDLVKTGGFSGQPKNVFQGGHKRWNSFWETEYEETEKKAAAEKKEGTADSTETGSNVVTLGYPPNYRGYGGQPISKEDFEKIQDGGCGWCHGDVDNLKAFAFLDEQTLVCHKCLRDLHPKETDDDDYDADLDDDIPFILASPKSEDSPEAKRLKAEFNKRLRKEA